MSTLLPLDTVFWYLPERQVKQLKTTVTADVVIVGGGMAGLMAAQRFQQKGCSVIVIEKNFCGAGASGKSSGFITPDSEYSLGQFEEKYGAKKAKMIWECALSGVDAIKKNIEQYAISCDYSQQDTLVVASSQRDYHKELVPEYDARIKMGYESQLNPNLAHVINAQGYHGGYSYGGTFGINGLQYLQSLKNVLEQQGVMVYEESPAVKIEKHKVITPHGSVDAKYVVLCLDRFMPDVGMLTSEVYHVQTFLLLSEPLTDNEVRAIFPKQPYMVWDTDLLYQYYRVTSENRLLLGGATLTETYALKAHHENGAMYKKLNTYWSEKFPQVKPQFSYMWPGLIGVSKDIIPLTGRDQHDKNRYYVTAAAGLPWAAALGAYAADALVDGRNELDDVLNPYRSFAFGPFTQKILGTRLTFALSHLTSLKSF